MKRSDYKSLSLYNVSNWNVVCPFIRFVGAWSLKQRALESSSNGVCVKCNLMYIYNIRFWISSFFLSFFLIIIIIFCFWINKFLGLSESISDFYFCRELFQPNQPRHYIKKRKTKRGRKHPINNPPDRISKPRQNMSIRNQAWNNNNNNNNVNIILLPTDWRHNH